MFHFSLNFIFPFLLSLLLSIIFTLIVKRIAIYYKILDYPNAERKIHTYPIPLLGGIAVFMSFFSGLQYVLFRHGIMLEGFLVKNLVGLFLASLVILIGGILDDIFNLKPYQIILFPVVAVFIIIFSGIGIREITNPFGGILHLDQWETILFWHNGIAYKITWIADIFTLIWLMGMSYTTKLLDGLDGLVSGLTVIGSVIIFLLSISDKFFQPHIAYLAILLAGSFLGVFIFQWHPAKIYLGESGSLLAGFLLGVLAIISGGKIATALLIMGIPILDVVWVIIRRWLWEKKSPFTTADKKHLHFRLLNAGLSHRQAVLLYFFLAAIFGLTTLFFQSMGKLIILVALLFLMLIIAVTVVKIGKLKSGSS